ncbi:MAG: T9SS type A sorting domain-containing protein [Flavobacteriaceae bacterium]|nr:MAG: T9SS type A sorting domain-containing protein [Flavobacteriaceae bacterium]
MKLNVTDTSPTINKLRIINVLGQEVKTISLEQKGIIIEDVSTLEPGIYFLTTEQLSIEPLKFIKTD